MDLCRNYRLEENDDGCSLIIELNPNACEFSSEIIEKFKENITGFDERIKRLITEKFSDVKINSVKILLGSMVIGTMPFVSHTTVQAADNASVQASTASAQNITGVVTATQLNVRSGPGTTYSIIHVLWQGNVVKVISQSSGWTQIQLSDGRIGWVSSAYLKVDMVQQKINIVLSTAKSLLGTPYVYGGESLSEGGFDCSGFTEYCFKQAGYTLNRVSSQQATQGTTVSYAAMKPGDLVFFSFGENGVVDHVGIYMGNGQMIHSPKTGDVVKTADITTSYWQSRFMLAKRIIF